MGNIVQVFGVGRDLLEQRPGLFQVGQVLLALVTAMTGLHQPVLVQDALNGHMAERQFPLSLQTLSAKRGQLLSQTRLTNSNPLRPLINGLGSDISI